MKIQQPKKLETRTKVDFLFERTNILSKEPTRKSVSKIQKKNTFLNKPRPELVNISHFFEERWDNINPHIT